MTHIHKHDRAGPRTHEQQRNIIAKREIIKGANVPSPGETLMEARKKHPRPPAAYDLSTGDRSIKHGANQESGHHKERSDD